MITHARGQSPDRKYLNNEFYELNELWDMFKHQTFRHHIGGTHYITFTAFASTSGLTIGFHDGRR